MAEATDKLRSDARVQDSARGLWPTFVNGELLRTSEKQVTVRRS